MCEPTICMGYGHLSVPDALERMTDEWIEGDNYCQATVFDMRYVIQLQQEEIERLRAYKSHHEFVITQIEDMLGQPIKVVGDLVTLIQSKDTEIERLRAKEEDGA